MLLILRKYKLLATRTLESLYFLKKATASKQGNSIEFTNLLSQTEFNVSDLSLLSWLQCIPPETFSCPFEQRSLNVDVERIQNKETKNRTKKVKQCEQVQTIIGFCSLVSPGRVRV